MSKRILFYAKRNLHLPHMEPVREWLSENMPELDIRISSPPYQPAREALPGVGLTELQIAELRASGLNWIAEEELTGWEPDVTVFADADLGGVFWGGKFVNVNHGLISKGTFYTTAPNVMRENSLHRICVPGEHHAEVLREVLKPPVVPTGFVKFDPIGRGEMTRDSVRKRYSLPLDAEVITLAPTFNLELSAVPVIADRVRDLVNGNEKRHLLIKLHGMAPTIWQEMYRLLASVEDRIHYIEEIDLTPPCWRLMLSSATYRARSWKRSLSTVPSCWSTTLCSGPSPISTRTTLNTHGVTSASAPELPTR